MDKKLLMDSNDDNSEEIPILAKERDQKNSVSTSKTLMNLLRGMIGPGCLALPAAFKNSGLWVGFVLTFLIGYLNSHCMMLLVHSSQYLAAKNGRSELDYGHLAKKVVDQGPHYINSHGKKALYATNFMIILYQMGVCSVQVVFMGTNTKTLVNMVWPNVTITTQTYVAMYLLPVILLCYIRQLKFLAVMSTMSNIMLLFGFIVVFQVLVRPPYQTNQIDWWFHDFNRIFLFLGSVLYAFEGQAMILPMENKMKDPQAMTGPFGVLHTSMTITAIIYVATGFFGFAKFGQSVAGSITQNLPHQPLYAAIEVIVLLAVLQGFALQFYVIIEAIWPAIVRKLPSKLQGYSTPLEYLFRTFLVLIQFSLAWAVPNLEDIIPLVGITAGSIISLIIPPLLDLLTFWDFWNSSNVVKWLWVAKNLLIATVGIVGLIAGLYANIVQISIKSTAQQ